MILTQSPWIWFIPVFIVLVLIVTIVAICICKWPRRRKVPRHVDPRIILKDVNHVEVISNPGVPASPSMPRFSTIGDGYLVRKIDLTIPPEVPSVDPPPLPSRPPSMAAIQKKASSKRRKSRKNQLRLVDDSYHGLEEPNFSTMIPDITILDMGMSEHKRYEFNLDPTECAREKLILD
ncbi:uncharacterized protein LOC105438315 [Strongylocentrotus purpuratus]|uniref:Uncharacterized protein n=1 Tax=Strongylocentrotus purpuratus TaxID=7668 RepID=A0A7M7HFA6_STRPU|nr:uncharacterized protein LOC105438315 [Strongylocentrotus purpuratus]|eukprot:XP_011664297.1 PREDICTED: uncharacterized protein LOC105438315 [Strongylocentrotus purpuratus]